MAGCVLHSQVLRVRMFGRFLGLYDVYSHDQLKCYVDTLDYLQNMYE